MIKKILIIPAFNEEECIVTTIEDIKNNAPDWDYVIINDGSSDNMLKICKEHGFNVITLSANLGLAGAFQTGMLYACEKNYDYAMQFDADGQHMAKYIKTLFDESQKSDVDIVIGSRFVDEKKPYSARMLGSRLITFMIYLTTRKLLTDPTSGMRLFNKKIIDILAKNVNCHPEPDTIAHLLRQKVKVKECQVQMRERVTGTSYLSFIGGIKYTVTTVISIALIQWFRKGEY